MDLNFLIVDDDADQAESTRDVVISKRTLGDNYAIKCVLATSFSHALELIEYSKFDLIILDLKDDEYDREGAEAKLSGERVLEQLRLRQFTPVVFFTGFPQKVEDQRGAFVKVVTKGSDPEKLRQAVRDVFETNLPQLIRHIQEEQRKYLWEHIDQSSNARHGEVAPNELAFLLGRRLANALAAKAIRRFFDANYEASDQVAHPIELYIWPPMGDGVGFGDILRRVSGGTTAYFVVLNPACDFAQCKAEKALLAECDLLTTTPEFLAIQEHKKVSEAALPNSLSSALKSLLSDNRRGKGVQPERYKFLPETSFVPNLVVDYQKLLQIPVCDITEEHGFSRLATLDTPFAEALQSRYVRYYGRIGTPDLEWEALVAGMVK